MRHILTSFFAVLMLLTAASPAAAAEGSKIGIVDLQKALNDCEEGKRARATLEGRFDKAMQLIEKKKAEVQQAQDDLEAQRPMLSASAVKEKEGDLQTKMVEFQQIAMENQQEMSLMEQELTGGILQKLFKTAQTIGAAGGYNLIIEKQTVVYINGVTDITDQVISRYNSKKD
jgi:outer membrane protein